MCNHKRTVCSSHAHARALLRFLRCTPARHFLSHDHHMRKVAEKNFQAAAIMSRRRERWRGEHRDATHRVRRTLAVVLSLPQLVLLELGEHLGRKFAGARRVPNFSHMTALVNQRGDAAGLAVAC